MIRRDITSSVVAGAQFILAFWSASNEKWLSCAISAAICALAAFDVVLEMRKERLR